MHTANIFLSPALIAKMVRCIEDAVGDDIRADIRQHDLQTKNSVPSRIWDLLNTFSDEDRLPELVQTMLSDLEGGVEVVRHHVLVLFDTVGYQLTHVRAVMVTPSLDIAQNSEQDWSQYIAADESTVVEKVPNSNVPGNQPNRGLHLTAKAMARQKSRPKQKELERTTKRES